MKYIIIALTITLSGCSNDPSETLQNKVHTVEQNAEVKLSYYDKVKQDYMQGKTPKAHYPDRE